MPASLRGGRRGFRVEVGGRAGGCRTSGARPRALRRSAPPATIRPPVRQPRSSLSGLVSKATSPTTGGRESFRRSAARPAQSLTSRPPPPGGGRRPESAFGSHSSRDCQQARRWCSSRLRPGTRRAALQLSARSLATARPKEDTNEMDQPAACRLPTPGTREEPAQNAAAAAEAAAGGSRSAARLGAGHEDPPSNSTTAHTTACFVHTHRLAPHRARGRITYQPPECQRYTD